MAATLRPGESQFAGMREIPRTSRPPPFSTRLMDTLQEGLRRASTLPKAITRDGAKPDETPVPSSVRTDAIEQSVGNNPVESRRRH